ncbi:hypothetical protein Taro_022825 [Colocasia esculenta]|uniref:Uncharacterized protein n=1 Tax=Colocasia esculenta TaxID=4460 RepID=A0A843V9I3_COLES|nr:hypothetical protein [Colocasia esculenta]
MSEEITASSCSRFAKLPTTKKQDADLAAKSESFSKNRRSTAHSLKRDENEKADFGCSRVDSPSEQWQVVRSEKNAKKSHSLSYERDMNKSGNSGRSPPKSPARHSRGRKDRYNSLGASRGENPDAGEGSLQKTHSSSKRSLYSPTITGGKLSRRTNSEETSPERVAVKESLNVRGNQVDVKLKEHHEQRNVKHPGSRIQQVAHLTEDVEYGPGKVDGNFLPDGLDNKRSSSKRQGSSSPDERPRNEKNLLDNSYSKEASRTDEKKRFHIEDKSNYAKKSRKQLDESCQVGSADTDSEEDEINRSHGNDKISKKSEINEASEEDYDSALDHRKEAKRKRKEERRMRKEEKRKRRDEKHRKREERRAQKKAKYIDTVTPPPDYERNNNVANNSDEDAGLMVSKTSDMEETESEQKQLEIDLRIKALESLRAKKAISH